MSDINNTTSRSELVDRCVRIALIANNVDFYITTREMALDIVAALKGESVTVTNTPAGLPPP